MADHLTDSTIVRSNDGRNTASVMCMEDSVRVAVEDVDGRCAALYCGDGKAGLLLYGKGMSDQLEIMVEDGDATISVAGKSYPLSRLGELLEGGVPAPRLSPAPPARFTE